MSVREVRTRPPIRVSQVISACSFCKARKIKCDGISPACGGCIKFGRTTTCSLSPSSGFKARDYPTYLHFRIQKLRKHLESIQSGHPLPDDEHHGRPTTTWLQGQLIESDGQQTPTLIDSLVADIGALPIQTSTCSSGRDGPSLPDIILGAASQSRSAHVFPSTHNLGEPPQSYMHALPNKDVAFKLAKLYIDDIYPRLPFFSIQGFWTQFNSVFQNEEGNGNAGPPQAGHYDAGQSMRSSELDRGYSIFTVLLVLAIATSSLSRSADSAISIQAHRLFTAALPYRDSAIKPNTIVGVQSLLFLIQYATLNPSFLNAWYLIGVGMRTCIDLGLHQDPRPLHSVNPSLLETRRILWWSIYSFDRSFSIGCGRPVEMSDKIIDVCLPTFRVESVATEEQIQGYLQRYRALRIQSEIYDALDQDNNSGSAQEIVRDLSGKLEAWAFDNSPSQTQILVESELLMGRVLLYRPCRVAMQRTRQDLEKLWESATRFISLYRQLVESNSIFYVQIAAEKTYWVGLAVLHSFWRLEGADGQSNCLTIWNSVQDILFILRTLGDRWEDGIVLAQEFEKLTKETLSVLESTRTAGENVSEAALPTEVTNLATYTSLTSLRAISKSCVGVDRHTDLRQTILGILT